MDFLRCPACASGRFRRSELGAVCLDCGHSAGCQGGVLDLRLDASMDTALDLHAYDAHHHISDESARSLIAFYRDLMGRSLRVTPRRVLEIGSGTGQLTWGLCNESPFVEVHCSDISPRFMRRLHEKLSATQAKPFFSYLFDANDFPFQDNTFSAVLGHSVLHHLASFESALENAFRVLEPGGIAVFGEPMMETHALVYLAAAQVIAADDLMEQPKLDSLSRATLRAVAHEGLQKSEFLMERPGGVHEVEDKFVFPSEYFRAQAERIGYSKFQLVQYGPVVDLTSTIEGYLSEVLAHQGAPKGALEPFKPLLRTFTDHYQGSMRPFVSQLFAFPTFTK